MYFATKTEQSTAKCYLLKICIKKLKFCKTCGEKILAPFGVIMIYTKQRKPLAVENSEMAAITLSLKGRQPCICGSQFSTSEKLESALIIMLSHLDLAYELLGFLFKDMRKLDVNLTLHRTTKNSLSRAGFKLASSGF